MIAFIQALRPFNKQVNYYGSNLKAVLMDLKHLGFLLDPMTIGLNFSDPSQFVPKRSDNRYFFCLTLLHGKPEKYIVLSGKAL